MSLRESVACCRKASFEGNGRSPWQERQRSGGARQARPSGPSGNRAACVTFSRQADACLQKRALSARLPEGQRYIRVVQRLPSNLLFLYVSKFLGQIVDADDAMGMEYCHASSKSILFRIARRMRQANGRRDAQFPRLIQVVCQLLT